MASEAGKNAGKKARSFDLNAMFAEARSTAAERSRETLEEREKEEDETRRRLEAEMHISLPRDHPSQSSAASPPSKSQTKEGQDDGEDEEDEEDIGPALPPGFKPMGGGGEEGGKDKSATATASSEAGPSTSSQAEAEEAGVEYGEWSDEAIPVEQLIPASAEIVMAHGNKGITALGMDTQGARLVSGCMGGDVKLWDFAGMDSGFRSFRQVRPYEAHVLNGCAFSLNGERILVTSKHPQPKLLERNGKEWAECAKGDGYLHDAKKTKGHTAALNGGAWHPWIRDEFMTSGEDGTVRLWSLEDFKTLTKMINSQRTVIRAKAGNGMKLALTSAAYSKDGKLVAAGGRDGSIQIWKHGGLYVNHAHINRAAHSNGCDVTSLSFSYDSAFLLSRSTDDTMKLWDLRSFKAPLHVATGLENAWSMTECCWSPRDELCVTGTSCRRGSGGSGSLVFLSRLDFSPVYRINFPEQSVVRCQWHPKINQVVAGTSGGKIQLYYDEERSARGALLCLAKPAKRERKKEIIKEEIILAPLGEKIFEARNEDEDEKEVTPWRVKKFLRMKQKDPSLKFPKQEEPTEVSAGGKVQASGSTLHQWFAQQLGVMRNKELLETNEDVRASILRHQEAAEEKSLYIGNIYKRTQPKPIFADSTEDPAEESQAQADEPLQPHFKKPKI